MGSRYIERIAHIEQLLLIDKKVIDKDKLREECSFGIPELLRPLCWRLFLSYLPKERQNWKLILKQQRSDYQDLVDNLIIRPGEKEDEYEEEKNLIDHPLASDSTSKWMNFFRENELLLQIDHDVRRLRPEIQFFQMKTNFPLKSAARINLAKRLNKERLVSNGELEDSSFLSSSTAPSNSVNDDEESEYHWQVVERILFIYSKVNPGIKYVQGMNELIGPIYYVFATDPDKEWAEYAEVDTFYCFQHLMSEIKDNFIKTLDQSNCGIDMILNNFHQRLKSYDNELYVKLAEEQSIKPQFYAFRWILLLLSQEFILPDLIFLWDAVFASKDRLDYIQYICLEMLTIVRNDLLNGDFSTNVRLLQNFPVMDISKLMIKANEKIYGNNSSLNSSTTSEILNLSNKSTGSGLFSNKFTTFMKEAKDKLKSWKKDDS